jgi:hypothetical protein
MVLTVESEPLTLSQYHPRERVGVLHDCWPFFTLKA